ncbi:alg11, partial [Symbiodinium sp. KB8]
GGERVLWVALAALEASALAPNLHVKVYTGDDATSEAILQRAKDRFNVDLLSARRMHLSFERIVSRSLLGAIASAGKAPTGKPQHPPTPAEASMYPRFTMLGQSLGSMAVAVECLLRFCPDVLLDTTGFAFTYPIARLAGCTVATYTHYPTITKDMLQRVHEARPTYNNDATISNSSTLTAVKLLYYRAFAAVYALAGACADVIMVNSSWTKGHIDELWRYPGSLGDVESSGAHVVFPPCNTEGFRDAELDPQGRAARRMVVSVAQFRPEKDHRLQLEALAALRRMGSEFSDVKLHLIGGCRNAEDEAFVAGLRQRAQQLGLEDAVEFRLNVPFAELQAALAQGTLGLHTMWNEHFGIGVVEMMASGLITIAHNSGGPRADIVVPAAPADDAVGFLASTPQEYADSMAAVLRDAVDVPRMATAARRRTEEFTDERFSAEFLRHFTPALELAAQAV